MRFKDEKSELLVYNKQQNMVIF